MAHNAHTIYDNFVLENRIEDMLSTNVDMNNYLTADYSLSENAGMVKKIHKYVATGDVQELSMGQGNTQDIAVSFAEETYTVGTTQGRFQYYDEEEMTDPMVVEVGLKGLTDKMTNDFTAKAIAELGKGSKIVYGATFTYNDVVDALAQYPFEDGAGLFMLINPAQLAAFRKNLKDDLKYVEANVRTGYIGTVCGVPVVISKAIPAGKAYIADKTAVTAFIKKGVEVEQERDANIRENKIYGRKVALIALTDDRRVIRLSTKADPRTGKTLVASKPSDWATTYTNYFKYDFIHETCAACTSADDWADGLIYQAN